MFYYTFKMFYRYFIFHPSYLLLFLKKFGQSFVLISFIFVYLAGSSFVIANTLSVRQFVAEASFEDNEIAEFYKKRNYELFWLGGAEDNKSRLDALFFAVSDADMHGLPSKKFELKKFSSTFFGASSNKEVAVSDVKITSIFLDYAHALKNGILVPEKIDQKILRSKPYHRDTELLISLEKSNANSFFRNLYPSSPEYRRLMKEKKKLEKALLHGGWGPLIVAKELSTGLQEVGIISLRNRLIKMGFLEKTNSITYDTFLETAVKKFQKDNGIPANGVADTFTISLINTTVRERLKSVVVAMERERWSKTFTKKRHISVNLADFSAKIVDGGKVIFETKTIIGFDDSNRRSPEFSDTMEYLIVNPSWYVPRSIVVQEYLPMLKLDGNALNFLELRDEFGNVIHSSDIDFSNFDKKTFPYRMRQPPGPTNALGLVKFMFPNENNIYLHDTPAKNLFEFEVRTFSHGCIRLQDPFGFAYSLLSAQFGDPKSLFDLALEMNSTIRIDLETFVPIHIIYRTVITKPGGGLEFREDIYGRDNKIWEALKAKGVVLGRETS